jgi:integrase
VGTAGRVRTYRTDQGWRARTLFRDYDGKTRHVERSGKSRAGAERSLAEAIRDRVRVGGADEITGDTRVAALATAWLGLIAEQHKSPTTAFAYQYATERHIVPGLGKLHVRELTIGAVHRFLRTVADHHGYATAKMCRSVLNGMCTYAARRDALDRNPVRDVGPIGTGRAKAPRALTVAEAKQLRALLTYDDKAIGRDLPDFVSFMLGTGCRIGEVAGLLWQDVDLEQGTVTINRTVVRLYGRGLTSKPTKSRAGERTLALPSWCVEMLLARPRTDPHGSSGIVGARSGRSAWPRSPVTDPRRLLREEGCKHGGGSRAGISRLMAWHISEYKRYEVKCLGDPGAARGPRDPFQP